MRSRLVVDHEFLILASHEFTLGNELLLHAGHELTPVMSSFYLLVTSSLLVMSSFTSSLLAMSSFTSSLLVMSSFYLLVTSSLLVMSSFTSSLLVMSSFTRSLLVMRSFYLLVMSSSSSLAASDFPSNKEPNSFLGVLGTSKPSCSQKILVYKMSFFVNEIVNYYKKPDSFTDSCQHLKGTVSRDGG
jgi:hypothetical protein